MASVSEPMTGHEGLAPRVHDNRGTNQKLWSDLSRINSLDPARLAMILDHTAPRPGSVVYMESAKLPCLVDSREPILFTAIDANTHLQISRIYLSNSYTSAVDFLAFARLHFPFSMSRVRTCAVSPFYIEPNPEIAPRFSNHLEAQGLLHTVISDPARDEVTGLLSAFSYVHVAPHADALTSMQELMREFITYLYYHNNHLRLPSLKGRTPLEKLHSFDGYDELNSFDPFASGLADQHRQRPS